MHCIAFAAGLLLRVDGSTVLSVVNYIIFIFVDDGFNCG